MSNHHALFLAGALALVLGACGDRDKPRAGKGGDKAGQLAGEVVVDGSSTVYPITEAVAEEFRGEQPRVRVNVGASGTGGGFKRFRTGEIDISSASRPIKADEYEAAKSRGVEFIELPIAYDGLSIVANKANDWARQITLDELRKIFLEGQPARTWKAVRPDWPDIPIKIYSPGTDSGTFDYFKEVIAGDDGSIRSDISTSEDDNVLVTGVSGERGAIGFLGCSYYFANEDKLRALAVVNSQGKAVMPTAQTIESGEYEPFSRPLFIYVNLKSVQRPEVDAFVKFYLAHGPELAEEVGYVKLPAEIYKRARGNYEARKTGTQYLDGQMRKAAGPLTNVYR